MRHYSVAARRRALAALEANCGNLTRTVEETGVPIGTLSRWRNEAAPYLAEALEAKTDYPALLGDAIVEGIAILRERLPTMSGKDAAIAVGILTDKYLNFTRGRRGVTVHNQVDNRALTLPEGTRLDDLRELRDELRSALPACD